MNTKVIGEATSTSANIISPFFTSLAERGIAREFEGDAANAGKKVPYRGTHVLHDSRQNSFWTEKFMSDELNLESICERLVDKKVRDQVVEWFKEPSNYLAFIRGVYPQPFIKFGERTCTAPKAVSTLQTLGLTDEPGYVVADMLLHVLAPTGTIEPTDPWYTSDVYLGSFPTFKNLMTEALKHELQSALIGLPNTLTHSVNGKVSVDVLAQRVAKQFEEVIMKLQGIGEYAIALQDVLLLIRSRAIPDVFMPEILDSGSGANQFDRDWVKNESIGALAGNVSLLHIALAESDHRRIRTMPHRLDHWITRVYSFLTGGARYKQLTLADFKSRYSKSTVFNNFGVPRFAVISQNVAPPAAAQAIKFLAGSKTSIGPVKMYEEDNVTNEMTNLFGGLPNLLKSSYVASVAAVHLNEDAVLCKETKTGVVHFAMDRYALGKRVTAVATEYDRSAVEVVLAIASYETCYIVEQRVGSGVYTYLFETASPRNAYQPASGARLLDTIYLADPAEAVMMASDWEGSYVESSHVQVIPNKALRMPYVNLEPLLFIDLTKDIKATIGYSGSIGGTKQFTTNLLKLMGRDNYSDYHAIAPLMVNTQGNNYYSVVNAIQEVVERGAHEVVRQAASAHLIAEVTSIATEMATGVMAGYSSKLRTDIATESPLDQQQAILSTLESKLYQTQINVVLAALMTRRLGVFEQPNGKDDVLLSVLSRAAFFLTYEMPIN